MSVTFYGDQNKANHNSSSNVHLDKDLLEKVKNLNSGINIYSKNKFFDLEFITPKKNDLAFIKEDENYNHTQSIYIYNGKWQLLLNCPDINSILKNIIQDSRADKTKTFSSYKLEELLKRKVNIDDLAPVAKTNNYNSLKDKPKIPFKTSELLKDDVFTKEEVEKEITTLNEIINSVIYSNGKLKNNAKDKMGFLEDKIDNNTLVFKDNLLKVEKLDGLNLTAEELNKLKPLINYIHQILALITAQDPISSFTFKDIVKTKEELSGKEKKPGYLYIVLKDKDHSNRSALYVSSDKDFDFLCELNGSSLSRDFLINPISLEKEITGVLNEQNIDKSIARKAQLATKADKLKGAIENNIATLSADGNTKDSGVPVNSLARKIHKHVATDIIIDPKMFKKNFKETDTDLQQVLNRIDTMEFDLNDSLIDDSMSFSKDKTFSINKINSLLKEKMNKSDAPNLKNLKTLEKISESNGELVFNNEKIKMSLEDFSTNDLKDYKDKRYVTDKDKNNLNKLRNFAAQQDSINQKLNNINQAIPKDISGNNPLVSDKDLMKRLKNLNFLDLNDVNKNIEPDSLVGFDSKGSMVYYPNNKCIAEITDSKNKKFEKIDKIKFTDLVGNMEGKSSLTLAIKKLYTKDLIDMPKEKIENGVLISNPYNNKYELKKVEDILFSKENFCKEISINGWSKDDGSYQTLIKHGLKSNHLIVSCYDKDKYNISLKYKIIDDDTIVLYSDKPIDCKCVINCSQSGNSKSEAVINASAVIKDDLIDYSSTYSSSKIEELIKNLADKNDVFTKQQCDNLFGRKSAEHIHANIQALNKLTEKEDQLYYNGMPLLTKIRPLFYECHWNNQTNKTLDDVLDVKTICNNKNYVSIMASELTIKNLVSYPESKKVQEEDYLRLIVKDNGMVVLDTKLEPEECQKYELGISPNITVTVQGTFDGNYYITAL